MKTSPALAAVLLVSACFVTGCATESNRVIETPQVQAAARPYNGPKSALVVGKFDNRSAFMRGLFSDGVDRLGSQAKTILITHLQQTGRFSVVDRDNMEEAKREADIKGVAQKLKGADYAVTGVVTEFGRKEVGDEQLFGIVGSGTRHGSDQEVDALARPTLEERAASFAPATTGLGGSQRRINPTSFWPV